MTTIARQRLQGLIVVGALAGVVGCADDKGAATGDSSGTTGGSTTGEVTTTGESSTGEPRPAECVCIPEDPDGSPASLPTCGAMLCPIVNGYGYDTGGIASDTPEALTCVLTALRDRTPGVVRWSASAGDESTNDGYVLILGGDAAIKRYWGFQDLTYEVYDAQYGELPPPAAFDTCLAAELAWERASCLFSLGLIPPFVVCDEGWSQSLL